MVKVALYQHWILMSSGFRKLNNSVVTDSSLCFLSPGWNPTCTSSWWPRPRRRGGRGGPDGDSQLFPPRRGRSTNSNWSRSGGRSQDWSDILTINILLYIWETSDVEIWCSQKINRDKSAHTRSIARKTRKWPPSRLYWCDPILNATPSRPI